MNVIDVTLNIYICQDKIHLLKVKSNSPWLSDAMPSLLTEARARPHLYFRTFVLKIYCAYDEDFIYTNLTESARACLDVAKDG